MRKACTSWHFTRSSNSLIKNPLLTTQLLFFPYSTPETQYPWGAPYWFTRKKEEKGVSGFNPLTAHQEIRSIFFECQIILDMEPRAKSTETPQKGEENYRGVFHLRKDRPEDNSSRARCSPSIKSAALFKSHLVNCKASNKTFQKLPTEYSSSNSHFSSITYSMLHGPVHPVLKGLKWCKAEANFKQNWVHKPAGFGTKKSTSVPKGCKTTILKLQSRAAWLTLPQPTGNFTGLSSAEMCMGIYWCFAIEMCNSLQEKAQLRPRGKQHLQSGSRLQLAVQVTWPPVLGFVCTAVVAAGVLPEAVEICAPMCCGVSLLQNTWCP